MNILKSTSFNYFQNNDREHDFDVILGEVVPRRKERWIYRKHSDDVVQQVAIPGK